MSEFSDRTPAEKFLQPGYWGGIDIFNDEMISPNQPELISLRYRTYRKCAKALLSMLRNIDAGNYTEIRHPEGLDFNPSIADLPDRSTIVLEQEELSTSEGQDYSVLKEIGDHTSPIFRPYTEYWKVHRGDIFSGREITSLPDFQASYQRHLIWGILHTDKEAGRVVQLFSFNNKPEASMGLFMFFNDIHGAYPAIKLPLGIGEVFTAAQEQNKAVARIKQVDIIYPAKSQKGRRKATRRLGKTILGHP